MTDHSGMDSLARHPTMTPAYRTSETADDDHLDQDGWVSRQLAAMSAAWDRGEHVAAATILEGFPEIDAESAIRLIYEEVCLRREAGMAVDTVEVVGRFPRWGDELHALFACDRLIGPRSPAAAFPEVGETLGPFRLLEELGRGASGRTFLAKDPALADRPVVVKVIPDNQEEHLALARLRHTHIVPLFSEHTFPGRGLRALCMPYLGGANLARIFQDMAGVPLARRSGRLLVERIDRATRDATVPPEAPFRRGLERAGYIDAVVWISACLADALHYAHTRGFVHMDVKPSNVLITADGQPMLLDFHLARSPIRPGGHLTDRLGGTPGRMSPEQRAAMDAVEQGRVVPAAVDGRSDVFALGLLLNEALAPPGEASDRSQTPASVRFDAGVSRGLADVVRKCLADDPDDRYPDAAGLADDLRRHLQDQPLKGVRNRSLAERSHKWRKRHPGAFAWSIAAGSLLFACAVALSVSLNIHGERTALLRSALENGRNARAAGRDDEAIRTLSRGLETAGGFPGLTGLTVALRDELRAARRGRTVSEFHELADSIRFRFGVELPPLEDARRLLECCRAVWERKDQLAGPDESMNTIDASSRDDLIEIAAVRADLTLRLAPAGVEADARRDVLHLLDEAEAFFGPSTAIDVRRQQLGGGATDRFDRPAPREPRTAWESYDLGRFDLRSGRIASASDRFRRALALRPQDFWPNFYEGLCAFRLGRFHEAVAAFRACVALAPKAAVCRYNRALAFEALGEVDAAFDDYSSAIELDPKLAPALLNRGLIHHTRGRAVEAIDDFEKALAIPPASRETRGHLRYNLALARLARGEDFLARASAEASLRDGNSGAALLLEKLLGRRTAKTEMPTTP